MKAASTNITAAGSSSEIGHVSQGYLFMKRCLDIIGAILGLLIASPLFLIIRILYCFGDSKGPLLFKQQRYGRNGRLFKIYKFRSMVMDAEEILKRNHELYQKYMDSNYKLEPEEDPRITRFGRFMRRSSIDELPQLINVLKGDMSLVGPRPIVEEELKEYKHRRDALLSVKPGMTGYWQVCGRSNVGYPERVELELYYVYHQSLSMDIQILMKTIFIVIKKKGAY